MMMKSTHDNPILVTGAAGAIGAIGRNLTAMLLAEGHKVRALVRREDERPTLCAGSALRSCRAT
jgi:nucleoside-diphosphate-sugar epimerase